MELSPVRGGIFIEGSTVILESGTIKGNSSYAGSGVYVDGGGTFTMTNGTIKDNSAYGFGGGGVYVLNGRFNMSGGTIAGNEANGTQESGNGGGVYVYGGTFEMSGGEIKNNKAARHGGGVYVAGGKFTMEDGTISENEADENGGGVYVGSGGTFTMNGGDIIGEGTGIGDVVADYGGGVMVYNGGTFTMNGGVIGSDTDSGDANKAAYGAGVFVENGNFKMTGGTIGYNHAAASFGGVAFYNGDENTTHTFDMSGGVITKNSSEMDPSALTGAQGVAIGCSDDACEQALFKMSGSASIPASNTIYLANGLYITVPEAFTTAEAGAKSLLFDEQYPDRRTVAVVSESVAAEETLSHFALSSLYPSGEYELVVDSSDSTIIRAAGKVKYTVTFNSNGGTAVSSQEVTKGGKAVKPADPTKDGYKFAGWYEDAGLTTPYDFNTLVTRNITLYVQWTEETTTVQITFHANSGTFDDASTEKTVICAINQPYGAYFPAVSCEGHSFDGWYTAITGGDLIDGETIILADAPAALYAHWTEHTYTIKFDGNGATSGSMDDQTNCSYDSDITLSMNTFNKTDYTFSGWIAPGYFYLIPDGDTVKYREDQVTDGKVTLKALWTANICTVSFYIEKDDTEPYLTRPVSYDSLIPKPDDPKKPGYTFDRWYNKADGKEWNFTTDKIQAAELNLYAVWTELPKYTITIHQSAGGTVTSSYPSAAHGTVIYLAVIPDSGYRLVDLNSEQVVIGPGLLTFTMPGEDVDIYPVFELIPSPSPVPSHSSESQGSSTWLTATPTPTPGVKPIEGPSGSSAKTPAPFLGILAGLGAAAVVFGLRRK